MRREREVERERSGGGSERAGQWLVDILPGPKPQTDRERASEREELERKRVKARERALFCFRGATSVNILFLSNQPLGGIQGALKFLYPVSFRA